jgi:CBS domain-containing protein
MNKNTVQELMETRLKTISPDATLEEAARMMKESDCGFLPVGEQHDPQGIITDRDIVIRAIAEGKDPSMLSVSECMTDQVCCCNENDTLVDAADKLNRNNVSRLVVKNEGGQVTGVLSFGRIIRSNEDKQETSNVVSHATGKAA